MQTSIASPKPSYWQWREQPIHYVQAGDRQSQHPSLLFVHGFGASTDHWRKNISGLTPMFDVWAIDLLGFGRSAKPDWVYSGDVWRDQLHDFIQTHIKRPTVLVGNSLGGYASLCVAAQYPDSVAGLILLNSAGPFSDSPPAEASQSGRSPQKIWQTLIRSILLQPLPSFVLFQYVRRRSMIRKTLEKVYLNKAAVTNQLVEEIYRPSCDPGAARVFASVFKSPRGEPVDALLQRLSCPLLMLWGEGDPWMNVRKRGAMFRQHYPQLTDYYLQAGHCPHDEVPDEVNARIQAWVEALGCSSSLT
ncbi:MAG: alpha/beta fold hydrolase [Elainellaceae cyanobacterium]